MGLYLQKSYQNSKKYHPNAEYSRKARDFRKGRGGSLKPGYGPPSRFCRIWRTIARPINVNHKYLLAEKDRLAVSALARISLASDA